MPKAKRGIVPLRSWRHHEPQPLSLPVEYQQLMPPNDPPTMAIVTPSFNQGEFLGRTIESVLSQNYPRLEYIVQDGGSTDDSVEVIRFYETGLTKWVSAPDGGQADAIVKGFEKTSGELMGWVNSDDLLLPGALNAAANYLCEHPEIDVVYGHRILIDVEDREIGRWVLPPHCSRTLRWFDYVPQETLIWRRSLWDRVGGIDPDFRFALDWDLLLRFIDAGANFARLPRFMGGFRVHEEQKSHAWAQSVGKPEVKKLRQRHLGFAPSPSYVGVRCAKYLFSHIAYDGLYRAGMLRS
ncbi:glycosyltransferase family 2 protein [Stratiformator vulcanicus]|nr:glycosyltransferase family 2 protein [Stratiformator vulcanicus]